MSAGGTWKNRLQEAIRASGKSQRDISLKAGMGAASIVAATRDGSAKYLL